LLLAQALPSRLLYVVLCVEACGIVGLVAAPATMQPQGLAARQLHALSTASSLVLLPFGNDGVGIPGPFIAAAPGNIRLEILGPEQTPDLTSEHRVTLITITVDAASKQQVSNTLAKLISDPCWTRETSKLFVEVFARTCDTH
jgi:hypothetical protein